MRNCRIINKKSIVIGIVFLFFIISFSPIINANTYSKLEQIKPKLNEKTVELSVKEYKSDGTIEETNIELTYESYKELTNEIKKTSNPEEKLAIYQKYKLIPEQVTNEQLRQGMEEKVKQMELDAENLREIANSFSPIKSDLIGWATIKNSMCLVEGVLIIGLRFYGGLSWFTSYINGILWEKYMNYFIPSVDLVSFGSVIAADLYLTNGQLPDCGDSFFPFLLYFIAGFVGFVISVEPVPIFRIPLGIELIIGYSAFGFGTGPTFFIPWL